MKFRVFISSVQSEFAEERRRLVEYIRQDALLGRFFDPFIFEETPACDQSARGVYLSDNGSVQVMLFRNRLEIINPGSLPKGWTVKKLLETHDSRSPNLTIAQALNWAGFVEKSGNGTESIISLCTEQGLKSPEYFADNVDFKAIVWRKRSVSDGLQSGLKIGQSHRPEIGQSQSLRQTVDTKILSALAHGESSRKQLSVVLGVSIQAGWFKKTLQRMLEDGLVEYSIPDKPQSRLQKYRLTEKAVVLMRRQKGT